MYAAYVPVSFKQVSMNEEGVVTGCEDKKVFEITGFRISGHAHDKQSGAAVKGVQVSLLSQDGHTLNTVETDEQGNYLFENVISGDYTLHADHPSCVLAEPTRQSVSVVLLPVSPSDRLRQRGGGRGLYRLRLQDHRYRGEQVRQALADRHRPPPPPRGRRCVSLPLLTQSRSPASRRPPAVWSRWLPRAPSSSATCLPAATCW